MENSELENKLIDDLRDFEIVDGDLPEQPMVNGDPSVETGSQPIETDNQPVENSNQPIENRDQPMENGEQPGPSGGQMNAGNRPPPVLVIRSADEKSRKLIQRQLVLLKHAERCERRLNRHGMECDLPHCWTMKQVWIHMSSCQEGRLLLLDCHI